MFQATTTCVYSTPMSIDVGGGLIPPMTKNANFQFASSSCTTSYQDISLDIASSSLPSVYNGFSYGEIIISLFMFMIFMVGIFSLFWFGIIKPHIHRIHLK